MTPGQERAYAMQRMVLVFLLKRAGGLVRINDEEIATYQSGEHAIVMSPVLDNPLAFDVFLSKTDDVKDAVRLEDI